MTEGGCLCGKCTTLLKGEPQCKALCYCGDCRKISGSTYSTNLFVASGDFHLLSGAPKQYSKITDEGNMITSHFCGDCGVTMWRETTGVPGMKIVKEGTLETLSKSKPTMEYYPEARIDWLPVLVQPKQEEGNRKEESVET